MGVMREHLKVRGMNLKLLPPPPLLTALGAALHPQHSEGIPSLGSIIQNRPEKKSEGVTCQNISKNSPLPSTKRQMTTTATTSFCWFFFPSV